MHVAIGSKVRFSMTPALVHSCAQIKQQDSQLSLQQRRCIPRTPSLSMLARGAGTLPLTPQLKADFPEAEQPWHANDARAGGNFSEIRRFFGKVKEIGPNFGCCPEPSKMVAANSSASRLSAKKGAL
jgi:hypothetical protein